MKILHWNMDFALKKEIGEHYRTGFALSIKGESPENIIKKITFDGVAPNLKIFEVEKFLDYVNRKFLNGKIKGVGVEVGAGPGFFSAILAKSDFVDRMYAVEACENIAVELMPRISCFILGEEKENKVVGCVGDFNNMEIEDNSVNFVFDFYSLHHSDNLKRTFSEINRILKPGGFVFCLDKARGDYLTDDDIQKMLNKEYSKEGKEKMGVDPDTRLTRRMNGEREYRLREWKSACLSANFSKFEYYNVVRCASRSKIIKKIKESFSLLPPKFQILFTSTILKPKERMANNLSAENRVYCSLIGNFPKEISLMVAYKK